MNTMLMNSRKLILVHLEFGMGTFGTVLLIASKVLYKGLLTRDEEAVADDNNSAFSIFTPSNLFLGGKPNCFI